MQETAETHSDNARHVILDYNGKIYYVNMVHVQFCEGRQTHPAVFCGKEKESGPSQDLTMEIPQKLYELLLEYTKLDNPDLILFLQVEKDEFKWGLTTEIWLKQHANTNNANQYIV